MQIWDYYFNKILAKRRGRSQSLSKHRLALQRRLGFRKGNNEFAKSFKDLKDIYISPGWEAIVDADSGDYYYFNKDTGETSWRSQSLSKHRLALQRRLGVQKRQQRIPKSFKDLKKHLH